MELTLFHISGQQSNKFPEIPECEFLPNAKSFEFERKLNLLDLKFMPNIVSPIIIPNPEYI